VLYALIVFLRYTLQSVIRVVDVEHPLQNPKVLPSVVSNVVLIHSVLTETFLLGYLMGN